LRQAIGVGERAEIGGSFPVEKLDHLFWALLSQDGWMKNRAVAALSIWFDEPNLSQWLPVAYAACHVRQRRPYE
jgi:hypothetical protein